MPILVQESFFICFCCPVSYVVSTEYLTLVYILIHSMHTVSLHLIACYLSQGYAAVPSNFMQMAHFMSVIHEEII